MLFFYFHIAESVFIQIPARNKYIDATSVSYLRPGPIRLADSIDLYPRKNNYRQLKLNIRQTNLFLTVEQRTKIIRAKKFKSKANQNFELVVDSSGYIRIMNEGLCMESIDKASYFALKYCSRSPLQLFDLVAETFASTPKKRKQPPKPKPPKDISRRGEPLTTSFYVNIPRDGFSKSERGFLGEDIEIF